MRAAGPRYGASASRGPIGSGEHDGNRRDATRRKPAAEPRAGGPLGEVRPVEGVWIVVALLAYVILMRWVLPRFGVPT
jgi:hypothetical protein